MKVLVTGGCGFIGSHIVEKLAPEHEVSVIDNLSTGNMDNLLIQGTSFYSIQSSSIKVQDIRNAEPSLFKNIDVVLHQAAAKSVPRSFQDPKLFIETNVMGTLHLILMAREMGVKRMVIASSSSVYGDAVSFPQKESHPCSPLSPYAISKLTVENLASVYSDEKMRIVCLRYFNVFGERQPMTDSYSAVIPKFINRILEGNPAVPVYGDGEQKRDFTYVGNVVEANISAMTRGEGIYNIACGQPKSINSILKLLNELLPRDPETIATYHPRRIGDVKNSHADISLAKLDLGWEPTFPFEEGLRRTIGWWKKQRAVNAI